MATLRFVPQHDLERGPAPHDEEEESDFEHARLLLGLAWRARRRRRSLSAMVAGACAVITLAVLVLWPRTYATEIRILAQRNFMLPALGNPNRTVPREADNPTKNVADVILRRDTLDSLIDEEQLLDRWETRRPRALRLKDAVVSVVGAATEADRRRALLGVLEQRLSVSSDDSSITIGVEWTDPQTTFDIASALQQHFLDARYDTDISTINDAIAILREHAKTQHEQIGVALAELVRVQPTATPSQPDAGRVEGPLPINASDTSVDKALVRQLEEKRARISAIEQERQRRLEDLRRKRSDALLTLASAHPTVVALTREIESASKDPAELLALRGDEVSLATRIGGEAAKPTPPTQSTSIRSPSAPSTLSATNPLEDPSVGVARSKLQGAAIKYADLEDRIDAAQIELDVARAAFKYRFSVVRPAEVPHKPRKPNAALVAIAGLLAAVCLAFLAPAALDLASGRFVERWQIERELKVPVLVPPEVT